MFRSASLQRRTLQLVTVGPGVFDLIDDVITEILDAKIVDLTTGRPAGTSQAGERSGGRVENEVVRLLGGDLCPRSRS